MEPPEHAQPDLRTALFGGRGTVKVWNLLGQGATPPFSAVLACELEPGGRVGVHVQQRDPEIIVGLGGNGVATVDDTPLPLVPGSAVYLPFGSRLSIDNSSADEALSYLIIKAEVAR